MKQAPKLLMYIGWGLVCLSVTGLLNLVVMPFIESGADSPPVNRTVVIISFFSSLILLVTAMGLSKGKRWAVATYITWMILVFLNSLLSSTQSRLASLLFNILEIVILMIFLSPIAQQYFKDTEEGQLQSTVSVPQGISKEFLSVIAAYFGIQVILFFDPFNLEKGLTFFALFPFFIIIAPFWMIFGFALVINVYRRTHNFFLTMLMVIGMLIPAAGTTYRQTKEIDRQRKSVPTYEEYMKQKETKMNKGIVPSEVKGEAVKERDSPQEGTEQVA